MSTDSHGPSRSNSTTQQGSNRRRHITVGTAFDFNKKKKIHPSKLEIKNGEEPRHPPPHQQQGSALSSPSGNNSPSGLAPVKPEAQGGGASVASLQHCGGGFFIVGLPRFATVRRTLSSSTDPAGGSTRLSGLEKTPNAVGTLRRPRRSSSLPPPGPSEPPSGTAS